MIKGIDEPVTAFEVREASGAPSRFAATATRGLTPLVGRDEEIRLLLSRWEDVRSGQGHLVLLTGEPGIGKSRIVQSFREHVRVDQATVLRYYCSPFYVHTALHPILDQLERAADLKKSDSAEEKLDKLEALLSRGCRGASRAAALLAPLLSIPTAQRYPPLDVAPERKKALMLEALLEQLAGLATPTAADPARGRALDRPHLDRAVPADHRAHPAPAGPGDHRLSAELHAALDRLPPRHVAGALAPQP